MVRGIFVIMLGNLLMMAGCESGPDSQEVNRRLVREYSNMAVKNAIVTQRTIYPYHFDIDTASLNELGRCELEVLAAHFQKHGGRLSVCPGQASTELHAARMEAIRSALAACGADLARVNISDGLPGGEGMSSERVLAITQERNSPSQPLYYPIGESDGGIMAGNSGSSTASR